MARPLRKLSGECVLFDLTQLIKPPKMSFFVCKLGAHEGPDQFDRDFFPDDAGPNAKHIHIVVLDPLVSRVRVVTDPRANARDLVRRNADPDAAAAQ